MEDGKIGLRRDPDDLRAELLSLARSVAAAVPRATTALLEGDLEAIEYLIQFDDEIDARALDIEDNCYSTLALKAPVASELRLIVAVVKIAADVERSADLITNICKAGRRLNGVTIPPALTQIISNMSQQSHKLFLKALTAFETNDASLAAALDDMDGFLDDLQRQFIQSILESHSTGEITLQSALQFAVIARFYERIGDHAVNIGERVHYVVTGSMPEHKAPAWWPDRTPMGGTERTPKP